MAVTKNIELLGTTGLSSSDSILAYNSQTFLNSSIVSKLGLGSSASLLSSDPTTSTVEEIYNILIKSEYILTPATRAGDILQFQFDNDRSNNISGQGFNTLIFLSSSEIIGFAVFESVQGFNTTTTSSQYVLKKSYLIKYITIQLTSTSSDVREDKDTITLLTDVKAIAQRINRDYSGDENYNYATKSDLSKLTTGDNNYEIHVNSVLKGYSYKDFFTDTTHCKLINYSNSGSKTVFNKLAFKKNLLLGSRYTDFSHTQISYYNGDPSLFIWDDSNNYSIFSLTTSMNSIFGDEVSDYSPLPYTTSKNGVNGKQISKDEIYSLPLLYEGANQSIEYFAGRYIVVNVDDTLYLFDILRQSGEIGLSSPLYDKNNGWMISSYTNVYNKYDYYKYVSGEWVLSPSEIGDAVEYSKLDYVPDSVKLSGTYVKIPQKTPNYINTFIVDRYDIYNRIQSLDSLRWSTYKKSINEVSSLSEVYTDSKFALTSGEIPVGKIGDWYIFKNDAASTLIYSNMTKSVKMSMSENEPIVVNDQVLLMWNQNSDGSMVYTLYDEPGYFITPTCFNMKHEYGKNTYRDGDSRSKDYKVYSEDLYSEKYLTLSSSDSPITLQRSFLGIFRRNVLPETLSGFKIIGCYAGLIYYRIENMINYL